MIKRVPFAFATFMIGHRYDAAVGCLIRRLHVVESKIPLVIVTDSQRMIDCQNCDIVHIESLYKRLGYTRPTGISHHHGRLLFERAEREHLFLKLWTWTLVEYKRILLVDSDIFVQKNIDWWMGLNLSKSIGATSGCSPNWFNSGTVLLEPSNSIALSLLRTRTSFKFCEMKVTDQSVLNRFFRNNWSYLPPNSVGYVHWKRATEKQMLLQNANFSLVHFVGEPKPQKMFDSCFEHAAPYLVGAQGLNSTLRTKRR